MEQGTGPPLTHAELVEFYDARDALFDKPIAETWKRFRRSRHPEARYVCLDDLFTPTEVEVVGVEVCNDPIKLLYHGIACGRLDWIGRAAQLGHPGARGIIVRMVNGDNKYEAAKAAADLGDRIGLYELGMCRLAGRGCPVDMAIGIRLIGQAARLGYAEAMDFYAINAFLESDVRYWIWRVRALQKSEHYLNDTALDGLFDCNMVLVFGRLLRGHVSLINDTIFGHNRSGHILAARNAVELYEVLLVRVKTGVREWLLCNRRNRLVCKDVARLIAKYALWEKDLLFF